MAVPFNYTFGFGNFGSWCSSTPSLAVCNLFYKRLLDHGNMASLGYDPHDPYPDTTIAAAGVGVHPQCSIPRRGHNGSLGNVGMIVACCLCFTFVVIMVLRISQRVAAVARQEMKILFLTYAAILPLQLLTSGSLLKQGSETLVVFTAMQEALQSCLYWVLLACAVVLTQVVDDGGAASLVPLALFYVAIFTMTMVVSLDAAYDFAHFALHSGHVLEDLYDPTLYTISFLIPLVGATMYALLVVYVSVGMLQEFKPLGWTILAGIFWALSLLVNFLWSANLCQAANGRTDLSFMAVLLQSMAMWAIFQSWKRMTESDWAEGDQTVDAIQRPEYLQNGYDKLGPDDRD
ncbi:hypothetical protein OC846_005765 [Tilletia horrida]|uniref:Chitin synthase export chaperone n=1 Tax=Tilletia horrida TaxID=155126 RepID=A0AAN6JPX4_9BASI|nr:hypothetical protein OC845_005896 [Tilletia horrida]KAK0545205.1 hypothetical protein OC846_005765 [Tilletia horrida]KAK0561199.1 hypothetical protein OC861_005935 [Tilletia horrida]